MSFIVAIEVAMPACGLFIIDEAMAASPIVALAADIAVLVTGVGDIAAGDMAFAVAMSTFPIVEEVEVVLAAMPFMPGMLAIFILAVVSFRVRWARWTRRRTVFVKPSRSTREP